MATALNRAEYRTGYGDPIPTGELVEKSEGERGYVLDADGTPLAPGDYALVLEGDRADTVVKVTSAGSPGVYRRGGGARSEPHLFWPGDPRASVSVVSRAGMTVICWGANRRTFRKVNLSDDAGRRLMLLELYQQRARLDVAAAEIEGQRVMLDAKIRGLLAQLGELGG